MKNLKKEIVFGLFTICMALILPVSAGAVSIAFNPTDTDAKAGDMFNIDIVISDLDVADLGGFDFNVLYDATILKFDDYELGSGLGDIDLFEALNWSMGDPANSGTIHLSELSMLWDLSFQEDSFTLATLTFEGLSEGKSDLAFSNLTLSDDWGDSIHAEVGSGSVTIDPVPEPSTYIQ